MRCTIALSVLATLVIGACGGESPEDREAMRLAARADSVAMADSLYDPTVFDTLTWESPEKRLERGGMVWRASCQKCHGSDGQGGGELAQQMAIDVPSFLNPEWEYAGDAPAIRRRIFIGHKNVMPNWGLYGLKYRDIDAVTAYIEKRTSPM